MIDREIKLKSRKRGLSVSEMVESLLAMWAAGGERAEDLDQFRQDKALALLLGHDLPAAQTARDFWRNSMPRTCRCCRRARRRSPPRRCRCWVWPRPMPNSSYEENGLASRYLVTCRHVAKQLDVDFFLRVNTIQGDAEELPIQVADWEYHPDETVDIAATSIGLNAFHFDHLAIQLSKTATKDAVHCGQRIQHCWLIPTALRSETQRSDRSYWTHSSSR